MERNDSQTSRPTNITPIITDYDYVCKVCGARFQWWWDSRGHKHRDSNGQPPNDSTALPEQRVIIDGVHSKPIYSESFYGSGATLSWGRIGILENLQWPKLRWDVPPK